MEIRMSTPSRFFRQAAFIALAVATFAIEPAVANDNGTHTAAATCDRACLEGTVDRYMAALVAHDPARISASPNIRFTENDQPLKLGQGTWRTVDGLGTYKHYFADPSSGQVGFIGTVREHGVPAFMDLRLRLEQGKITEAESFIIRDAGAYQRYEKMGKPEATWLETVPPAQRLSRTAMVETVNKYFQSMSHNDGRGDYSFFHPDCNRIEHALQTTNVKQPEAYGHSHDLDFSAMGCADQFKTGFLGFVTDMRDRRFPVIDAERQTVYASVSVDQNGTVRSILQSTGKLFVIPDYFHVPRTLQVQEAFKIRDGKLYRIEMTLIEVPYGQHPPFDTVAQESTPAAPSTGAAVSSDRAGLILLADQAVQALMVNDGSRLPLAENFRYTENGQPLRIGDGLWGTLSAYAGEDPRLAPAAADLKYRLDVVEPESGQIIAYRATDENGTRGVLAVRLKLTGGKISEMEAVVIRHESVGTRGGTVTLLQPLLLQMFDPAHLGSADPLLTPATPSNRGALIAVANSYFDGQEANRSQGIPFDPGCVRHDNGHLSTAAADSPPLDPKVPEFKPWTLSCAAQIDSGLFRYIEKVRDRRFVTDTQQGLVAAIDVLDIPGTTLDFTAGHGKHIEYPGTRVGVTSAPAEHQYSDVGGADLRVPQSLLSLHLFKIQDGKIARLETFSRGAPYGLLSGW
jgi:hypothetical protein